MKMLKSYDTDRRYFRAELADMSQETFCRLSAFIREKYGINITPTKKIMLEGRLRKRLRQLGMSSFHEYCDFLFNEEGAENESKYMIDEVTTNKTDFFRELNHFTFLVQNVVPELMSTKGCGLSRKLTVWSAGCSTGEEPYTIAMVLHDLMKRFGTESYSFQIIATDISKKVLKKAQIAVYEEDRRQLSHMSSKKDIY